MAGPREELQRLAVGLGVWLWLPVVALLTLIVVIAATPGADCDGIADDLSGSEAITLIVALAASLGAVGAALRRIVELREGPGVAYGHLVATLGGCLALVVIAAFVDLGDGVHYLWSLAVAGIVATAALFVGMFIAWLMRRTPDEAGLLVPAYLLGAAIFVFPGFAILANGFESGAFC